MNFWSFLLKFGRLFSICAKFFLISTKMLRETFIPSFQGDKLWYPISMMSFAFTSWLIGSFDYIFFLDKHVLVYKHVVSIKYYNYFRFKEFNSLILCCRLHPLLKPCQIFDVVHALGISYVHAISFLILYSIAEFGHLLGTWFVRWTVSFARGFLVWLFIMGFHKWLRSSWGIEGCCRMYLWSWHEWSKQ